MKSIYEAIKDAKKIEFINWRKGRYIKLDGKIYWFIEDNMNTQSICIPSPKITWIIIDEVSEIEMSDELQKLADQTLEKWKSKVF